MNHHFKTTFLFLLTFALPLACLPPTEPDPSTADWVIMVDGSQYTHELDTVLRGVLGAIPQGQQVLILSARHALPFTQPEQKEKTDTVLNQLRPSLFMGAHRLTELQNEASPLTSDLSVPTIRQYLVLRRAFFDLYAQDHNVLWSRLQNSPFKKGARIVLLVQKADFPIHSRQDIQTMSENETLRNWVLEIQAATPFEQKRKGIKATCAHLQQQENRVDTFYLNNEGNKEGTNAIGRHTRMEVSRALFSGLRTLSKKTGGQSANGGSDPDRIIQLLNS